MLDVKKWMVKVLGALVPEETAFSITKSSGALSLDNNNTHFYKVGNVVYAHIRCTGTGNTASGTNYYVGQLNTANLRPLYSAYLAGFVGGHSVVANIDSSGVITIRNASSSAYNPSGGAVAVGGSYIVGGNT